MSTIKYETEIAYDYRFGLQPVKATPFQRQWMKCFGLYLYAIAHPEISAFCKEGNPSVAIWKV